MNILKNYKICFRAAEFLYFYLLFLPKLSHVPVTLTSCCLQLYTWACEKRGREMLEIWYTHKTGNLLEAKPHILNRKVIYKVKTNDISKKLDYLLTCPYRLRDRDSQSRNWISKLSGDQVSLPISSSSWSWSWCHNNSVTGIRQPQKNIFMNNYEKQFSVFHFSTAL